MTDSQTTSVRRQKLFDRKFEMIPETVVESAVHGSMLLVDRHIGPGCQYIADDLVIVRLVLDHQNALAHAGYLPVNAGKEMAAQASGFFLS